MFTPGLADCGCGNTKHLISAALRAPKIHVGAVSHLKSYVISEIGTSTEDVPYLGVLGR